MRGEDEEVRGMADREVDAFRRLLEPIGKVPLAEFEAAYYRREDTGDRGTQRP